MENTINNSTDEQIYHPETHFIVDKSIFCCIICFEKSLNLYRSDCCESLICSYCVNSFLTKKCPICKEETSFSPSKLAKRLISNSISICQICKVVDIFEKLKSHLKDVHLNTQEDLEYILENPSLYEMLLSNFGTQLIKKFLCHSHEMKLVKKNEGIQCYGTTFYKNENCEFLKREENLFEEKNKKDIIFYQGEEKKAAFIKNFTYNCEECNIFLCNVCKEIRDKGFVSRIHEHELKLTDRSYSWTCDGRKDPQGCKNEGYSTRGKSRFRCNECDFDLCENCMEFYMLDPNEVKIENDEEKKEEFETNDNNEVNNVQENINEVEDDNEPTLESQFN